MENLKYIVMLFSSHFKSACAVLAATLLCLCGCKQDAGYPSADFAGIIKAYTGSMITDKGSVRIELAADIPGIQAGDPVAEGLLAFSPALRGTAVWTSPSGLVFTAEPGALKPGAEYTCTLQLDKLMRLSDPALARFSFPVRVAPKVAGVTIDHVRVTDSGAALEGTVSLSQSAAVSTVQAMLPEAAAVQADEDGRHFQYTIGGYQLTARDQDVKVQLKETEGFQARSIARSRIPGTEAGLRVVSSRLVEGASPFIEFAFSEPLKDIDGRSGQVQVWGVGRASIGVQDNILTLWFDKRTADEINVRLYSMIQSVTGGRLGEDYNETFTASEPVPAVELMLQGNILPDNEQLILPFRAVNLRAVDLSVIKIYENNVLSFLQENSLDGNDGLRRSGRKILSKTIPLDGDPKIWSDYSVDLSGLFKQEPGAIYRIRLSFNQNYSTYSQTGVTETLNYVPETPEEDVWDYPSPWYYDNYYDWETYDWKDQDNPRTPSFYMKENRFPVVNLLASNIGMIAKYAGGDRILAVVNDIITAKPMYGVDVTAYNYQLQEIGLARTNSDGIADIQLHGKPFVLAARRGDAAGYLKVADGEQKSLSRFDVGGQRLEKGLKGYVYGERGVWRPGDTLHVTLVLHDKEARIPDSHPAFLELYGAEGQFYCKQICPEGKDGFYTFAIPTRADDPTGIWNAYVKVGGASFHKALRIETIKPNRLKIDTELGGGALKAGSSTPVNVSSRWLTGPAAAGLQASVSMTLRKRSGAFEGFDGYVFTNPTASFTSSEHTLWQGRLDANGQAHAIVGVPTAADAPGMLTAHILSTVMEQGGDESFVTMTQPFSPFSAYVGVKSPGEALETDADNRFSVAVVSPEGKRVTGHRLEYQVFKMEWSWWWENDPDRLASYVNGSGAKLYDSGTLTSAAQDVSFALRVNYPDWGRFLVYVKDLDSGHASGMVTFVDWPSWRGRADRHDPDAVTMLSFSLDKKSYNVGETATVYIPAADGGKALVSLENASGVLSTAWVSTSASEDTPYKFKVTPEMAPNFYVHITLLQPHKNTANDLPIRMYGVEPVLVSNPDSRLEPVISMADNVHPDEEFTVKVSEKSGKPMTYTLAIVDEGLLDITSFKTPDPWHSMYAREALGVSTFDLYDQVAGALSGRFSPMLGIGGDEDMTLNAKRDNRFNAVVKFLGPFTLKKGADSHKVRLPMYVGSVRVMVVAGTREGAYGNAQKSVTVKSPLMVVPTLPRVISAGEKVTLPVNVFALEDGVKNAQVKVQVEGPVKIAGTAEQSVSFSKPGDEMVRFQLETTGEGFAHVTVSAAGSGQKTSETIHIEVRNPNPYLIALQRQALASGATANLAWKPFQADEKSWARLELASFPAIDFDAAFAFVRDYAYNCSEQLSARGIDLVYTLDFLSEENAAKAKELVPVILQELYARQLADGGFAYWPGMSSADTWVSSMAGQFLLEAKAKGFDVSKSVLSSWTSFQKKGVQNWRKATGRKLDDLDQAYRLYTLALAGSADNASMNRLKENPELTPQARWMLASAYALCGKAEVAKGLLEGIDNSIEAYSDRFTYGSSVRDKALAIEALTLSGDVPQALELAQEVADIFGRGWYSTQELAFASVAMKRLAAKTNHAALEATVDGKAISSPKANYSMALNPTSGKAAVTNKSQGTVYASLVTVSRSEGPVQAAANGLRLKVSYVDANGADINPATLTQGSEFAAVITVTNTSLTEDLYNLALTQMVPSGWEIRNERMTGGADMQNNFRYNDIRDDRNLWYFDLPLGKSKTFKTRLRAAYEGEFVLPAIKCEAMYNGGVFANTASGKVSVTR